MSQTPLSELNACSKPDFVKALANIFEYSPWIAEQAASVRPFAGVNGSDYCQQLILRHAFEHVT